MSGDSASNLRTVDQNASYCASYVRQDSTYTISMVENTTAQKVTVLSVESRDKAKASVSAWTMIPAPYTPRDPQPANGTGKHVSPQKVTAIRAHGLVFVSVSLRWVKPLTSKTFIPGVTVRYRSPDGEGTVNTRIELGAAPQMCTPTAAS
ncbi:hypothetical protein G9U51_00655 [Calidifontibacter sp. DB0510]|uniref:Uncharacterized protein n=1 Tax=Metallococcus carri TaxID=1656884 RepID=A0A967AXL5_9MICO|nr:hypothetical protein [Metallococcus carri]NHN54294.1 hypothetical protein [Metallococcus carri]NOP36866.1 hypothetical protein [Calidifontibacter sp. DB2511S]